MRLPTPGARPMLAWARDNMGMMMRLRWQVIRIVLLTFLALSAACRSRPSPQTPVVAGGSPTATALPLPAAATATVAPVHFAQVTGTAPQTPEPLETVVAKALLAASHGKVAELEPILSSWVRKSLQSSLGQGGALPMPITIVQRKLAGGPLQEVVYQGGRAIVLVAHGKALDANFFYVENGHWTYDPVHRGVWSPPDPGPQTPENRTLTLADATKGIAGTGELLATLQTSQGPIRCVLHDQIAPLAVANFIGLARGVRGSAPLYAGKTIPPFNNKPYYDGQSFYRTVAGVMIETGDPAERGTGHNGYQIADELDLRLRHDKAGILGMASVGPNTSGATIYLTARPAPWMDDRHTIFGLCGPVATIDAISRAPVKSVSLKNIEITRSSPAIAVPAAPAP